MLEKEKQEFMERDFSPPPPPSIHIPCPLFPLWPIPPSSLAHTSRLLLPCRQHVECIRLAWSCTCPGTSKNRGGILSRHLWLFLLSSPWQTVKDESLALPAVNPLVTPQKGSTLDNSLHKDLLGAISGIGNAPCSCGLLSAISLKVSRSRWLVNVSHLCGRTLKSEFLLWVFFSCLW